MEAKESITNNVTKHTLIGNSKYSSGYTKAIILLILLILTYKICISERVGDVILIHNGINRSLGDTNMNMQDSNRADTDACLAPTLYQGVNFKNTEDVAIIDTLNMIEQQNENLVDSMVNSYFRGINFADSTYKIKKLYTSGASLLTILATPLVSVFPVAISSAIFPSVKHLQTNVANLNDKSFVKGYRYEAHYLKKRKLWGSFMVGGTPWCIVMGFLML
jgi:hypothetical protein